MLQQGAQLIGLAVELELTSRQRATVEEVEDEPVEVKLRRVADLDVAEKWRWEQLRALGFDREQAFTLALLRDERNRYVADLNKIRSWRKLDTAPSVIYRLLVD